MGWPNTGLKYGHTEDKPALAATKCGMASGQWEGSSKSQADLGGMGASRREETQVSHGDLVSREAVLSE